MADATKVDPKTCRTIPVITKPDLIDSGAENAVKELLLGDKKAFRLGFHMTKCRGQKALNEGTSLTEGVEQERLFFSTTLPWSEIEDRSLFGVESLREKLAELQVRMIEESLPSIMKEVGKKKVLALEELEKLGKSLSIEAGVLQSVHGLRHAIHHRHSVRQGTIPDKGRLYVALYAGKSVH